MSPRPSLVFVGFMGAGKTTQAREAAKLAGAGEAADSDRIIEAAWGKRIAEVFDREERPRSAPARSRSSAACSPRPTAG